MTATSGPSSQRVLTASGVAEQTTIPVWSIRCLRGLAVGAAASAVAMLGGCAIPFAPSDPGRIGVGWESDGSGTTTIWLADCRGEFDPVDGHLAPTSLMVRVVPEVDEEATPVIAANLSAEDVTATRSPDGHFWLVPVQGLPPDDLLDVSTPAREDGPWYAVIRLSGTEEPLRRLTGEAATEVINVTPEQLFSEACQYR